MKWNLNDLLSYAYLPKSYRQEFFFQLHLMGAPVLIAETSLENEDEKFFLSREEVALLLGHWGHHEWRLLEILLAWMWTHWRDFNPCELQRLIQRSKLPAVWGVIREWTFRRESEMSASQKAFWTILTESLSPADNQFLVSEGKIQTFSRSKKLILETDHLYSRWGFICRDFPSIAGWKNLSWEPSPELRTRIIKSLVRHKLRFSISEYLEALNYRISRQTAWRDLQSNPLVKTYGSTKGRFYTGKRFKHFKKVRKATNNF